MKPFDARLWTGVGFVCAIIQNSVFLLLTKTSNWSMRCIRRYRHETSSNFAKSSPIWCSMKIAIQFDAILIRNQPRHSSKITSRWSKSRRLRALPAYQMLPIDFLELSLLNPVQFLCINLHSLRDWLSTIGEGAATSESEQNTLRESICSRSPNQSKSLCR